MQQNLANKKSLFERIGGESTIHAVVDRMYKKMMQDPVLQPFFVGVDMAYLQRSQVECMIEAFGGPCPYASAYLKEASGRIKYYEAIAPYLQETLVELQVSPALITEVLNLR